MRTVIDRVASRRLIGRASAAARRTLGRVRAALRGRPARRACACLAAGLLGVAAIGAVIGAREGRGDGRSDLFRPAGMDVHRAGHMLGQNERAVAGCLRAGAIDRSTEQRAQLSRLFEILSSSATAREALRQAEIRNVHVCVDDRTELLAYYFAGMGVVGVSTELTEGGKIVFLAHELAHVPQHPVYSDNRYFPPDDLVLLRRVREAAAEATATRIAWELRENGYAPAWDEKITTPYGDVARAFEAAITANPPAAGALRASRAAFDQWFDAPWRLEIYDRMTLDHLERISADEMGLVPPRYSLTHAFLQGIAWLDGGNFLAGTGERALTDPFYAGKVSAGHAGQLERFLQQATNPGPPLEAWSLIGAPT